MPKENKYKEGTAISFEGILDAAEDNFEQSKLWAKENCFSVASEREQNAKVLIEVLEVNFNDVLIDHSLESKIKYFRKKLQNGK